MTAPQDTWRPIGDLVFALAEGRQWLDLPLAHGFARVQIWAGTVQVVWHRGDEGPIAHTARWNEFVTPDMGNQLRALADAVDAAWAAAGETEGQE